jgi:putative flippase GtrA
VIRSQNLLAQMLRYGVVGLVVLAADFLAYALVVSAIPAAFVPANWLGKLTGAALGFVLHKHATFGYDQRDRTRHQLAAYAGLFLFNLALSSALLWLLVTQAGWNAYLAKLLTDIIVIGIAFAASRLWIYRPA